VRAALLDSALPDARFPDTAVFASASLSGSKTEQYAQLRAQARALMHGEPDRTANAANLSALVYHALPGLNWVGFYFHDGKELVVGPFQGKPACVRIALGRGVCGTAAATRETQVVPDVEAFPGHIPCDSASRSELVVPLYRGDTLIGVFDLDSPELARFDADDRVGLEALAAEFLETLA
jgi:L-methionine (R)-S-oxide reductase